MRISMQAVLFSLVVALLFAASGCPRSGGGGTADETVVVLNAGQRAVRVGVARPPLFGGQAATAQSSDTITDLTPPLQPGESTTLLFPAMTTSETFNVFVTGIDTGDELLGPFSCRIDRACRDIEPPRLVWTGATVLCANLDQTVIELVNESSATAYLLIGDEQPALPTLPFAPGETRFTQLARTAGSANSARVRAVTINPILGPLEVAVTQCGFLQPCRTARVRFDGQFLECDTF